MGILAWIIVGLVAGWLAKLIVPGREPKGFLATTAIGVVGAMIGGLVWNMFNHVGVTGVDFGSILVATVGAIILLIAYHAFTDTRTRV